MLAGFLNGIIGAVKTSIGEGFTRQGQAVAMGYLSFAWGTGTGPNAQFNNLTVYLVTLFAFCPELLAPSLPMDAGPVMYRWDPAAGSQLPPNVFRSG